MARISSIPVAGENYSTITVGSGEVGHSIIGIVLKKEIAGGVKIRPTNVTATISSVPYNSGGTPTDPDYILLHNGPKGGFSQELVLGAVDQIYRVNDVIEAVITKANL